MVKFSLGKNFWLYSACGVCIYNESQLRRLLRDSHQKEGGSLILLDADIPHIVLV